MRGRKRKPSALSRLDGNPGEKKILEEPKPEPLGDLEPPSWLDAAAKGEWRAIVPVLLSLGLLSVVDRSALSAYCRAFSQWRAAEISLDRARRAKQKGKTYADIRDRVIDTVRLAERMRHFLSEFGLSPVSRQRLAEDPDAKKDAFDKFMARKGRLGGQLSDAPSPTLH